jgi:tetratricopeptide (TPR) repeat protein
MIAKSARKFADPAEREAYLDRVCRGIARLRADVERHLAEAEAEAMAEPEPPPAEAAPQAAAPVAAGDVPAAGDAPAAEPADVGSERPGDTIGRYRLVKSLGEGGFGTVWLAEQFQPVRRQVALKIIKLGMDTAQVVARFEQERQALALMDHPNVARVLDAGATASGRPYFVMDLVQGVPIHEYCDRERLSVPARLRLFTQVCAAVQHAHMKGIIHRDLKPSNVLVSTRDGKPHATVIDFGIAKATSSKLTDRSLVTEAYQVIGTLQYMSPEQSQASPDIDTRTDVYSLGVILYELLAGTTPYDSGTFERAMLSEILRMIAESDPPPPSARVTSARDTLTQLADTRATDVRTLPGALRGDLDWIVLRAIEKDRDRRYESAEALAADIRRHLEGEEVLAAPPSGAYRMRKFVRRHRGPVAAAAAVAASLVAGVIAFAWQAGVARDERDAAVQAREAAVKAREAESVERKRSEDVATLMESLFEGVTPDAQDGRGDLRSQLVERLGDVTRQLDAGTGDPMVGARIRLAIGTTLMSLAEPQAAEAQFRTARETLKKELAPGDPRIQSATLGLAGAVEHCGRFGEAVALVEEARAEAAGSSDGSVASAEDLDHMLGMIRQAEGRLDLAVPLFEAAAAAVDRKGGPKTSDDLLVLHTLATAYRDIGRPEEAVTRLRDVLARRRELLGEDHTDTLMTANSLAVSLTSAKRLEEALAVQKDTLDALLRRRAPEHTMVLGCEANLAGTLSQLGRHDEAIARIERICRIADGRFPPESPDRVRPHMVLVSTYAAAGRLADATRVFDELRPRMWAVFGPAHDRVASLTAAFAHRAAQLGDASRAVAWLEEGAAAAEKARGPDHESVLEIREALGAVLRGSGDAARAAEILADVVERSRRTRGADDLRTLSAMHALGCAQFSLEQGEAAVKTFEETLTRRRAKLGEDHADTLETQGCLGSAHWLCRQLDRSVPLLQDTLARQERTLGAENRSTLATAQDLLVNLDDARDAERLFDAMRVWLPRLLRVRGTQDPMLQSMASGYLGECSRSGRQADAVPVFEVLRDDAVRRSGPDDPEALRLGANLAASLWAAGALDRSVPIFEDVYARRKRLGGPDDPDTLKVAANFAVNLRDAGRVEEAVALFEDTIRRDLAVSGPSSASQGFLYREYAKALHGAGRTDEAVAAMREFVAGARRRSRPGTPPLASDLVQAGMGLLEFGRAADAESVLRECVEIRAKAEPAAWTTHVARSLLGGALCAQGRFADAEPLVVGAVEALLAPDAKVPPVGRRRVDEARVRVLDLYTKWHEAEPGAGHDAKLAAWRERFSAK